MTLNMGAPDTPASTFSNGFQKHNSKIIMGLSKPNASYSLTTCSF